MLTNIFTKDLEATRDIFINLLDFKLEFESDWFVSMYDDDGSRVSAMLQNSEFIPSKYQHHAQGVMITIVVDDAEPYFIKAKKLKLNIIEKPKDMPYGQRRFLIEDPSGILIDISSPTAPVDPSYT